MSRNWRIDSVAEYGPDVNTNPRLAALVVNAKKSGFPKSSIESAIARGQGISPSGAILETMIIEAMLPPAVAAVIECQTDSKARTLQDLRLVFKDFGATMTPTSYMFEKRGKVVFEMREGVGEEDILERAIEAGALDVDVDEDGRVVVYTDPSQTTATAQALTTAFDLKVESSEIIWDPKVDTKVDIDTVETANMLSNFVGTGDSVHALIAANR